MSILGFDILPSVIRKHKYRFKYFLFSVLDIDMRMRWSKRFYYYLLLTINVLTISVYPFEFLKFQKLFCASLEFNVMLYSNISFHKSIPVVPPSE